MVLKSILGSLITIFLLIIPGIVFQKKGMITKEQEEGINHLIVNLTWPCLIIDAMQIEYETQILKDSVYTMGVCFLIFGAIFVMTVFLPRRIKMKEGRRYLLCFMLLFGNTGFIGIPVMKALYGGEAVFYAAIIEMINDIFIFTLGVLLIQKSAGADLKMQWKNLFSPGMVGVLLGLSFFLLRITLPTAISQAVETLGNATTPLTMFMIGVQLGSLDRRELFRDHQIYLVSLLKLILIPVCVFLFFALWKSEISLLEKTIILSFAMPVGSVAAIFSKQYESDAEFAAKSVLVTTVCCMITIPIFSILMEL